jgi:hypothetical protein
MNSKNIRRACNNFHNTLRLLRLNESFTIIDSALHKAQSHFAAISIAWLTDESDTRPSQAPVGLQADNRTEPST